MRSFSFLGELTLLKPYCKYRNILDKLNIPSGKFLELLKQLLKKNPLVLELNVV